jgi:hypothetical protein
MSKGVPYITHNIWLDEARFYLLIHFFHIKKLQPVLNYGNFPCNESRKYRSPVKPLSVHRLMPGDIDIIAALGDSLTAGFGASASSLWQVPIENRGLVWSIGKQGLIYFTKITICR